MKGTMTSRRICLALILLAFQLGVASALRICFIAGDSCDARYAVLCRPIAVGQCVAMSTSGIDFHTKIEKHSFDPGYNITLYPDECMSQNAVTVLPTNGLNQCVPLQVVRFFSFAVCCV